VTAALPLLRLLRIGTLFSPAADVVASACLARLPWTMATVAAVVASVLLYAAGMVWNDVADRRTDAVVRPERPLPRGDLSVRFAVTLGTVLLVAGIAVSPCPLHHGTIGALVLVYDFAAKHVAWLGALCMGSLRALNLGTALALGGSTIPADLQKVILIAAVCYGVYITAVTILGIFEDTPNVRPRAIAAVQVAPPLAALCGLWSAQGQFWPAPALASLPILWFLRGNSRRRTWDQPAIRRSMTFLLLGTMLYTALLALASERPVEAACIAAAILPARWISRRIALT
jgi:4-hydroxybenzoate polyprenyltransferase